MIDNDISNPDGNQTSIEVRHSRDKDLINRPDKQKSWWERKITKHSVDFISCEQITILTVQI